MRLKKKKLTDDDIAQYCKGVEELLSSIHEKNVAKKKKKPFGRRAEGHVPEDEDALVLS
jgi:hypothetical protein